MNQSALAFLPLLQASESTPLGTVYQTILDGGWMMLPIALCSVVSLTFFVERLLALGKRKLIPKEFAGSLAAHLEEGGPEKALDYVARVKAPVGPILAAGLRRWHGPRLELEKALEDVGRREVTRLSGNLRPLVVVTVVAPLLGLLGTVLGMIQAFQVIATQKGIGKPELLAEGISVALVTTAAGLIVAIPSQVAYFYLKARIDRFARAVESLYHDVLSPILDAGGKTRKSKEPRSESREPVSP